jgi:hypothetical protein
MVLWIYQGMTSLIWSELLWIYYVLDLVCFFLLPLGKEYRGNTFVTSLNLALYSSALPGWIACEQDWCEVSEVHVEEYWTAPVFCPMDFGWKQCVSLASFQHTTLSRYEWWERLCVSRQWAEENSMYFQLLFLWI